MALVDPIDTSGIFDLLTKDTKADSGDFYDWIKDVDVDWSSYSRFSDWFKRDSKTKQVSSENLVELFSKATGVDLNLDERTFLRAIFQNMPKELRSTRKQEDNTDLLVSYVNLLPVIGHVLSKYNEQEDAKFKGHMADVAKTLSQKLRVMYVNQEMESLGANPETAEQFALMSEEEKRKFAERLVNSSDESPLARIIAPNQILAAEDAAQVGPVENVGAEEYNAVMDQAGFPAYEVSARAGIGSGTMDERLIANMDLTVNDLAQLEVVSDETFSDGFNMAGIIDPNNKLWAKDETTGKSKSWSAFEATKLIYDLYERGDTETITRIQQMMLRAGYYMDTRPVRGVVDDNTKNAWNLFLTDAARMNRTPADQARLKIMERKQIRSDEDYESSFDPAGVRQTIQSVASQLLNRTLSDKETASVMDAIRRWEQQAMTSGLFDTDPTEMNFEARISEYIERQNEDEMFFNLRASVRDSLTEMFGTKWQ